MERFVPSILVVEDDAAIADTLLYALRTDGFDSAHVTLGESCLDKVKAGGVNLVILDVGLPDLNGFEVCKALRQFSDVPVIFLTARNDEVDRIVGLEIGADDYVVKPFSPREVVTRVRTVLKRLGPLARTGHAGGASGFASGFRIDEARVEIRFRNQPLELTRYEYRLLKALVTDPGRVFSRDELMHAAWEHPDVSLERTVDTHIKQLRAKLKAVDASCNPIRTHRGLGYSLAAGSDRE